MTGRILSSNAFTDELKSILEHISPSRPNVKTEIDPEVPEKEQKIADELKPFCHKNMQEKIANLGESAKVLFKLGKYYLHELEKRKWMNQKLSIIRCSALLNAAKIRFAKSKNQKAVNDSNRSLRNFSRKALELAGSTYLDFDLLRFSDDMLTKLQEMRDWTKIRFSEIKPIHHLAQFEDDELYKKEKRKIAEIKVANEEVADKVKAFLVEISEICIYLLGQAPCKFAQVGLGSLARKETTPYSDFEHVIVLEEGAQDRDDYEEILEYFRWFTVIDQIIIINFGETFVKSVAVPSLTWFYDAVTPVGMAFDGMAPQASNNPLGRGPTDLRPASVELIKPIGLMVNYLSNEEQIKNGYYLHEVLTKTCYVYGDENVCTEFRSLVRKRVETPDEKEKIKQFYFTKKDNVLPDNQAFNKSRIQDDPKSYYVDVKRQYYRPFTTILCSLARMHGITNDSNFDIVDELEKKLRLDPQKAHDVKFALAIACEIRQKVYIVNASQRHFMPQKQLVEILGSDSVVRFHIGLWELHSLFDSQFAAIAPSAFSSTAPPSVYSAGLSAYNNKLLFKVDVLKYIEHYQEGIKLLKPTIDCLFQINSPIRNEVALFYGDALMNYTELLLKQYGRRTKQIEEVLAHIPLVMKYIPDAVVDKCYVPYYFIMIGIYQWSSIGLQNARVQMESLRPRLSYHVNNSGVHAVFLMLLDYYGVEILSQLNQYDLAIERSNIWVKYWTEPQQSMNRYKKFYEDYFHDVIKSSEAAIHPIDLCVRPKQKPSDRPANDFGKAERSVHVIKGLVRKSPEKALRQFVQVWNTLELRENLTPHELEIMDDLVFRLANCTWYILGKKGGREGSYGALFCENYLKGRKKYGYKSDPITILIQLNTLYLTRYEKTPSLEVLKKWKETKARLIKSLKDHPNPSLSDLFLYLPLEEALRRCREDPADSKCGLQRRDRLAWMVFYRIQNNIDDFEDWIKCHECILQEFRPFIYVPNNYQHFMRGLAKKNYPNKDDQSRGMKVMLESLRAFRNAYQLPPYLPKPIAYLFDRAISFYVPERGEVLANHSTVPRISAQILYQLLLTCNREEVISRCCSLLFGIILYELNLGVDRTMPTEMFV